MELVAKTYDKKGKAIGEAKLSEAVFGLPEKEYLVHEAVFVQLSNRRSGTSKTKTRGEVRGGGSKPFRQKGTGSARRGTERSPLLIGGGTIFGPSPRDHSKKMPVQVRRQAVAVVLSHKVRENKVYVLEDFAMEEPKTKLVAQFMSKMSVTSALFVDADNEFLRKGTQNIPRAKYSDYRSLNVFDLLKFDCLFVTAKALKAIQEGKTDEA